MSQPSLTPQETPAQWRRQNLQAILGLGGLVVAVRLELDPKMENSLQVLMTFFIQVMKKTGSKNEYKMIYVDCRLHWVGNPG